MAKTLSVLDPELTWNDGTVSTYKLNQDPEQAIGSINNIPGVTVGLNAKINLLNLPKETVSEVFAVLDTPLTENGEAASRANDFKSVQMMKTLEGDNVIHITRNSIATSSEARKAS